MRSTRRTRERLKQLSWLTEAQAALGWGVILILVALLGAIYLNQASRIAAVGRRVQILQNELESLKRENAELARQVAESQSIERLQQEAIRLGFVRAQPDDIEYIIVPDYPVVVAETASPDAAPEAAAAEASAPIVPPQTMREAMWLMFKAGIGNLVRGEASE